MDAMDNIHPRMQVISLEITKLIPTLFYYSLCCSGDIFMIRDNVDPGNLKQPNLYLFSSTLKNDIVTTMHHENVILDGG